MSFAYTLHKYKYSAEYVSFFPLCSLVFYKYNKYPHNYPNYWVDQEYLPENLKGRKYYNPRKNKFETEMYKFNQSIKQSKNTSN